MEIINITNLMKNQPIAKLTPTYNNTLLQKLKIILQTTNNNYL